MDAVFNSPRAVIHVNDHQHFSFMEQTSLHCSLYLIDVKGSFTVSLIKLYVRSAKSERAFLWRPLGIALDRFRHYTFLYLVTAFYFSVSARRL